MQSLKYNHFKILTFCETKHTNFVKKLIKANYMENLLIASNLNISIGKTKFEPILIYWRSVKQILI